MAASLVKYDNPVLVSSAGDGKRAKGSAGTSTAATSGTSATQDILNSILPPREWTADGQLWVQHVSSTPATRLDVINLQEQLDLKLQQRQARETGICPIREELYAQCFDELIRQVTINCAERGLLLLRVRDEVRMTISAYQTLYESSVAFGIRKALMCEQRKSELRSKVKSLRSERAELQRQVATLREKLQSLDDSEAAKAAAAEEAHNAEVERQQDTIAKLRSSLEELLQAPSKK